MMMALVEFVISLRLLWCNPRRRWQCFVPTGVRAQNWSPACAAVIQTPRETNFFQDCQACVFFGSSNYDCDSNQKHVNSASCTNSSLRARPQKDLKHKQHASQSDPRSTHHLQYSQRLRVWLYAVGGSHPVHFVRLVL